LESANPDAFDDNSYGESLYEYCIGESYSEWLRKDIASQKQKQNTQKDVPYPFPK
jgi:hypothetical protein